jgi:hypothetical protein
MDKKAIMAPVFKYIFVLVAGALMLLFFVQFAFNMVDTKKEVITTELGFLIDDSLLALTVSEDQSDNIPSNPWPDDMELAFGKGNTCGKFSSGSHQYPSSKIVFSPSKLTGDQILAWTQTWSYPFKVDNFFFLTNKNSKYFLAYDTPNKDFVESIDSKATPAETLEHIPKSFDVQSFPYSTVGSIASSAKSKYDFVKVVMFGKPCSGIPTGVRCVSIEYEQCEDNLEDDLCRGKLTFDDGKKSFFVGKPMLYGAIFTEDFQSYSCQISKIYKRMTAVLNVNIAKADFLYNKDMQDGVDDCSYSAIKGNLNYFSSVELAAAKSDQQYNDYAPFESRRDGVSKSNKELSENSACMVVF